MTESFHEWPADTDQPRWPQPQAPALRPLRGEEPMRAHIANRQLEQTTWQPEQDPDRWVADAYDENRAAYWRDGIKNAINNRVQPLGGRLRVCLNGLLRERLDESDES